MGVGSRCNKGEGLIMTTIYCSSSGGVGSRCDKCEGLIMTTTLPVAIRRHVSFMDFRGLS